MAERKYADCIISPEIRDIGNGYQALEYHGKDDRGYDFGILLSAIGPDSTVRNVPVKADGDRTAMYLGGVPSEIGNIGTDIEVTLGDNGETRRLDAASMVYIPKGQSFKEKILKAPTRVSWLYSITLPPKYVEPENP